MKIASHQLSGNTANSLAYLKFIISVSALVYIFLTAVSIRGQEKPADGREDEHEKALRIITLARQAALKKVAPETIKSFSATVTGSYQPPPKEAIAEKEVSSTFESKWAVELPDKLSLKESINYSSNQEFKEIVLNNLLINSSSSLILNGNIIKVSSSPQDKLKKDSEYAGRTKIKAFVLFFPLLSGALWNREISFRYAGLARISGSQADIIEGFDSEQSKWQLFFDQNTHLLQFVRRFPGAQKDGSQKIFQYFLTDFSEDQGFLIAHKIVTQVDKEVIEEQHLKEFKSTRF